MLSGTALSSGTLLGNGDSLLLLLLLKYGDLLPVLVFVVVALEDFGMNEQKMKNARGTNCQIEHDLPKPFAST